MEVAPQKEVNALLDGGHAISAFWKGRGEEESIDQQETLPSSDVVGSCQLSHRRHRPAIVAFARAWDLAVGRRKAQVVEVFGIIW